MKHQWSCPISTYLFDLYVNLGQASRYWQAVPNKTPIGVVQLLSGLRRNNRLKLLVSFISEGYSSPVRGSPEVYFSLCGRWHLVAMPSLRRILISYLDFGLTRKKDNASALLFLIC